MRRSSKLVLAVLAVAIALLTPGSPAGATRGAADDDDATAQPDLASSAGTEILAVVNAEGGKLEARGTSYRLVLTGVAPRQLWFTDRPSRRAGTDSVEELNREFFADQRPPNAALEVTSADDDRDVVLLEISNPRYERRQHRLTYDARSLETETSSVALAGYMSLADEAKEQRFENATLFIDDADPEMACPAFMYPLGPGYITSLSGVTCATAQAVVAATTSTLPCNNYEWTALPEGTWGCQQQDWTAPFEEQGGAAGFYWMSQCVADNQLPCD